MLIVQSLANLREIYGADGAANFMGNCELQLFMAPTDADTPRYISEAIGDQTRMVRVKSWRQRGLDAASIQERQEGIRLIRPEQIRMLGPDAAIALVRDQNPVRLFKARYYEDPALNALFEGQKASASLKDPGSMPEAPLPGADTDGPQKGTTTELDRRCGWSRSRLRPSLPQNTSPRSQPPSCVPSRESSAISEVPSRPTARGKSLFRMPLSHRDGCGSRNSRATILAKRSSGRKRCSRTEGLFGPGARVGFVAVLEYQVILGEGEG